MRRKIITIQIFCKWIIIINIINALLRIFFAVYSQFGIVFLFRYPSLFHMRKKNNSSNEILYVSLEFLYVSASTFFMLYYTLSQTYLLSIVNSREEYGIMLFYYSIWPSRVKCFMEISIYAKNMYGYFAFMRSNRKIMLPTTRTWK